MRLTYDNPPVSSHEKSPLQPVHNLFLRPVKPTVQCRMCRLTLTVAIFFAMSAINGCSTTSLKPDTNKVFSSQEESIPAESDPFSGQGITENIVIEMRF